MTLLHYKTAHPYSQWQTDKMSYLIDSSPFLCKWLEVFNTKVDSFTEMNKWCEVWSEYCFSIPIPGCLWLFISREINLERITSVPVVHQYSFDIITILSIILVSIYYIFYRFFFQLNFIFLFIDLACQALQMSERGGCVIGKKARGRDEVT